MNKTYVVFAIAAAIAVTGCDKVPGVSSIVEQDDARFEITMKNMRLVNENLKGFAAKSELCMAEYWAADNAVDDVKATYQPIYKEITATPQEGVPKVDVQGMKPSSKQINAFVDLYGDLKSNATKAKSKEGISC